MAAWHEFEFNSKTGLPAIDDLLTDSVAESIVQAFDPFSASFPLPITSGELEEFFEDNISDIRDNFVDAFNNLENVTTLLVPLFNSEPWNEFGSHIKDFFNEEITPSAQKIFDVFLESFGKDLLGLLLETIGNIIEFYTNSPSALFPSKEDWFDFVRETKVYRKYANFFTDLVFLVLNWQKFNFDSYLNGEVTVQVLKREDERIDLLVTGSYLENVDARIRLALEDREESSPFALKEFRSSADVSVFVNTQLDLFSTADPESDPGDLIDRKPEELQEWFFHQVRFIETLSSISPTLALHYVNIFPTFALAEYTPVSPPREINIQESLIWNAFSTQLAYYREAGDVKTRYAYMLDNLDREGNPIDPPPVGTPKKQANLVVPQEALDFIASDLDDLIPNGDILENATFATKQQLVRRFISSGQTLSEILLSLPGLININEQGYYHRVENPSVDAQGFVALYPNFLGEAGQNKLVICLRGTEFTTLEDWVTNLLLAKIPYPLVSDPELSPESRIHLGFFRAYFSLKPLIELGIILCLHRAAQEGFAINGVVLCGHSMGGALCTVAVPDVLKNLIPRYLPDLDPDANSDAVDLFTYGAPRSGNQEWAAYLNGLPFNSYNFRVGRDLVPRVPFDEAQDLPPSLSGLPDFGFGWQHLDFGYHYGSNLQIVEQGVYEFALNAWRGALFDHLKYLPEMARLFVDSPTTENFPAVEENPVFHTIGGDGPA